MYGLGVQVKISNILFLPAVACSPKDPDDGSLDQWRSEMRLIKCGTLAKCEVGDIVIERACPLERKKNLKFLRESFWAFFPT